MLVLESGDPEAAVAEAARLDPVRVPRDEVRVVSRIPRDPRHASKIDYGALEECMRAAKPPSLGSTSPR